MTLHQQITEDMKSAMKSGDKARLDVVRFILSQLNAAQKEKALKEPGALLADEETVAILQKEAKRRKESIELFKQGGRNDLVEKETADLAIIMAYLPAQMPREEIEKVVSGLKAQGITDFSDLMRETMKAVKGRADGKLVTEVVKAS